MARTVLLGKPDQLKIDTMKKTIEALENGIKAVKPGNTADDVAQGFWKILDKYGNKFNYIICWNIKLNCIYNSLCSCNG